ncbi:MAG: hypothetical protein IPH16_05745 [Haliscomenobacter sp.]|nr:hypothetical protein [Haliscomenobacter sp.]
MLFIGLDDASVPATGTASFSSDPYSTSTTVAFCVHERGSLRSPRER